MSERKQFETYWKEYYGTDGQRTLKRDRDGQYEGILARWAWIGWSGRARLAATPDNIPVLRIEGLDE